MSPGTTRVAIHTATLLNQTVHFIDTPGFDDSRRSDSETLQELAYWLGAAYEQKIQLSGIIYLSRITDNRLRGTAHQGLRALKAMCGDLSLHGVVFATTMWDKFAPELVSEAFERHEDLRRRINQEMGDNGGHIVALTAGAADAVEVVEQIVRRKSRITLEFQRQLIEEDRPLHETDVGKVLLATLSDWSDGCRDAMNKAQEAILTDVQAQNLAARSERNITMKGVLADLDAETEKSAQIRCDMSNIRNDWEKRLRADSEALDQATRTTQELFTIKTKALEELNQESRSLVPTRLSKSTQLALVEDLEQLGRQEEIIMWRKSQRLETKHAHPGGLSSAFGVVGTTLALGQLIAAMSCAVM
jgi:hypothetical protein